MSEHVINTQNWPTGFIDDILTGWARHRRWPLKNIAWLPNFYNFYLSYYPIYFIDYILIIL